MAWKGFIFSLLVLGAVFAAHSANDSKCVSEAQARALEARGSATRIDLLRIEQLCKTVGVAARSAGPSSVGQVLQQLVADQGKRGDRLKPPAPVGLPTGLVLPSAGYVEFDFTEVMAESPQSLDVTGPGLRLRLQPDASSVALVPVTQLRAGVSYRWVLVTRRQSYDAKFELADEQTAQRVKSRLDALKGMNETALTSLVLEAAIYDDEELFASRDRTIARLRRELQKP